jgi:type IV secretory pathway VirB6-like protein
LEDLDQVLEDLDQVLEDLDQVLYMAADQKSQSLFLGHNNSVQPISNSLILVLLNLVSVVVLVAFLVAFLVLVLVVFLVLVLVLLAPLKSESQGNDGRGIIHQFLWRRSRAVSYAKRN